MWAGLEESGKDVKAKSTEGKQAAEALERRYATMCGFSGPSYCAMEGAKGETSEDRRMQPRSPPVGVTCF